MVRVVPAQVEWLEGLVVGDDVFTQRFGVPVVPGWVGFPEVLHVTLEATRRDRRRVGTQPIFDEHDGALVGFGGLKGRRPMARSRWATPSPGAPGSRGGDDRRPGMVRRAQRAV